MALAISHRNRNSTGPRADVAGSLIVGGMVRIEAQRGLVKQQEGLFALCRKNLGFIAARAKSATYPLPKQPAAAARPAFSRKRESRVQRRAAHTRPSVSSPRPTLTRPHCPHAPAPGTLAPCKTHSSTTTYGSAPESRGLFRTGAKTGTKDV